VTSTGTIVSLSRADANGERLTDFERALEVRNQCGYLRQIKRDAYAPAADRLASIGLGRTSIVDVHFHEDAVSIFLPNRRDNDLAAAAPKYLPNVAS
jgi:hypothetical protein